MINLFLNLVHQTSRYMSEYDNKDSANSIDMT